MMSFAFWRQYLSSGFESKTYVLLFSSCSSLVWDPTGRQVKQKQPNFHHFFTFNNNNPSKSFIGEHSPYAQGPDWTLLRKRVHRRKQSREIKDRGQSILEIGKHFSPPFEKAPAMKMCNINKAGDALKAKAFLPGLVLCGEKRLLLAPCS